MKQTIMFGILALFAFSISLTSALASEIQNSDKIMGYVVSPEANTPLNVAGLTGQVSLMTTNGVQATLPKNNIRYADSIFGALAYVNANAIKLRSGKNAIVGEYRLDRQANKLVKRVLVNATCGYRVRASDSDGDGIFDIVRYVKKYIGNNSKKSKIPIQCTKEAWQFVDLNAPVLN